MPYSPDLPHSPGHPTRGISAAWACIATSAWIVAIDNFSFWRTFFEAQQPPSFFAGVVALSVGLVLVALFGTVLRILCLARLGLVVMTVVLIASAAAAHYVDSWGVLFDKAMIRNIVETDFREARELLAWPALTDLALRGLLPAGLLWYVGVRQSTVTQTLVQSTGFAVSTAVLGGIVALAFYGTLATTLRIHRELRFQLVPSNYINATYGFLKTQKADRAPATVATVAADATRKSEPHQKPKVLILVVGETARAANFSLGGYARDTNAALSKETIFYFDNVTACGTDTATSVPCMFSDLGAANFTVSKAQARENVLDILQKTGIDVVWFDNNSGCKGVCDRVLSVQMPTTSENDLCSEGACQDGILIEALKNKLSNVTQDATIVLHQLGSHGPAYYKRYPQPGRFQPTCDTNRIQTCPRQALVNTYDNSIDYTTQVLAQAIDAARQYESKFDMSLLYISDHGESLGEKGIYLHGVPPMLAPSEQRLVPMLVWFSPSASKRLYLPQVCITDVAKDSYSHDNLFHTLLGLQGVATNAYNADLDIFARARKSPECKSIATTP
jgi:lipid A ethanolaminephosphotransferase